MKNTRFISRKQLERDLGWGAIHLDGCLDSLAFERVGCSEYALNLYKAHCARVYVSTNNSDKSPFLKESESISKGRVYPVFAIRIGDEPFTEHELSLPSGKHKFEFKGVKIEECKTINKKSFGRCIINKILRR